MNYYPRNSRTAADVHRRDSHRSSRLDDVLYGDYSASRQRKQVASVPRIPPRYSPGTRIRGDDTRKTTGLLPMPQIDAVWIPNMSKNITVDMGLGITKDIDLELEELSRLRRIGDFATARKFFKENFPDRVDDPYFFVLNAQMLLEMGDFRSFDTLRPTQVFGDMENEGVQKNQDLLRESWNLLILLAMLPGRDCTQQAVNEIDKALALLEARVDLGSIEIKIQILASILRLLGYITHSLGFQSSQLRDVGNAARQWTDWASVYHHLASEGRVWDFRDLFTTFKLAFGRDGAFDAFFNTWSLDEVMDTLDSDWETVNYDKSTNLALLDILGFLILESDFETTPLKYYKTCLEHGEKLAESLMDEDPETAKSGPFARWLVAKAAVLSCDVHGNPFSSFRFLDSYPGMQIRQGDGVHIPIYVPLRSERPTWKAPEAPPEWKEAVHMALGIAKNLGDYETQSLCLKHLIIRSQEPHMLLGELSDLQNSIQDDQDSYLRTCLSKFLILSDAASQRGLAEDLFRFGQDKTIINQALPIEHHNVSLQWARSVILPTLPGTIGGTVTIDKSGSFYAHLPTYIRHFISTRETFHTQSEPTNSFPTRGTKLRQWPIGNIANKEIERSTRLVPESEALVKPRVQTLASDKGGDGLRVHIRSRYGDDRQREIDRQNEKISKRSSSARTFDVVQTGNETVQTLKTEPAQREVPRGGTAKKAKPFQTHGLNATTNEASMTVEEIPEDHGAEPQADKQGSPHPIPPKGDEEPLIDFGD
ncbi:uncharacterized protein F4817DRAFT_255737 [Daldinia loculata]|uniref:uncharacterized protein n=1 Tax=Daldinia loculata TaxID=103429 RepID=UPI0020C3FDE3|nr:uncharacterized protein F4817DRAFT_255737 [Daldinia loculata]KAI1643340.1 hypothetical protein F4817DRAFT_255737 [Daldinia loculata]